MSKFKCGLEIHVYIDVSKTNQKLFCCCEVNSKAKPNTNICPVCTAQPGSKPALPNKEAVEKVIKTALMFGCKINKELVWQRKHYSWPDLPTGYQKTMSGSYAVPVGEKGSFLGIGITEVHLEEDPARWDPVSGSVDYNRSGYSLIEIVTDPDFRDVEKVREWLKALIKTLTYVKAVNKNMGVKCDVNVSIPPKYGRTEIKNVNSFKSIVRAIEYEISRQQKEVSKGKRIEQQTRAWDDKEGTTKFMRSKEQALDYRFIPDPDLPIVEIKTSFLSEIKKSLPESPDIKAKKITKQGVSKDTAEILAGDLHVINFLDKHKSLDVVWLSNWLRKELLRVLNLEGKDFEEINFKEKNLLELITLWKNKDISPEIGRSLLEELAKKDFSPKQKVEKENLQSIKGESELETFAQQAIKEGKKAVEDYKKGSEKALNSLVGLVMKKTKGKASPSKVKEILKTLLK
jgi:aspartyl-tRNA(Asn)/glutamyl-tRNA(Gln) amidotransferase subunit B